MFGLSKYVMASLLLVSFAWAQPYVVSDPQCKYNGSNDCAEGFEVSTDGGNTWQPSGAIDVGADQIRLSHDLVGTTDGAHNIQVRAVNVWRASDPVPFGFTAGAPSQLNGLRITDQP